MRSGASVSQLLALSSGPRGARITLVLSSRLAITSSSIAGEGKACVEHRAQRVLDRVREFGIPARRIGFLRKVTPQRKLHLYRVDLVGRPAIGARDPAALEAAVDDAGPWTRSAFRFDRSGQHGIAGFSVIGAEVEDRQLAGEQARNHRPNGVAVIEDDAGMLGAQPLELIGKGRVV